VAVALLRRRVDAEAASAIVAVGAEIAQTGRARARIRRGFVGARLAGAGLGRDDDDAARRALAVQHRAAAAQHLDALDRLDRDAGKARAAEVRLRQADAV